MNGSGAKVLFVGLLVFICLALLSPYFGVHILTDAPDSKVTEEVADTNLAATDDPVQDLLADDSSPPADVTPDHDSLAEVEKILGN